MKRITPERRRGAIACAPDMPVELGEWGAREMALVAPDPRTKARPVSLYRTGRSPAVMMAWVSYLRSLRNAVQFATEQVCA